MFVLLQLSFLYLMRPNIGYTHKLSSLCSNFSSLFVPGTAVLGISAQMKTFGWILTPLAPWFEVGRKGPQAGDFRLRC